MAASVNNIAAAFSASRISVSSSAPTFASSPSPSSTAAFSSSIVPSGGLAISASWNPHSALPRHRFSSLLSVYGPPGPRPASCLICPPAPSLRSRGVIAIGDCLPHATLSYLSDSTVRTISTSELSCGKKIVILGVPAAFTSRWWPCKLTAEELLRRAGEMKARGAAVVACVSVNDVFVMKAWGESIGAMSIWNGGTSVMMLSDPDAGMTRAMGLMADFTGSSEGFGLRSENYCLVAADGIVKAFFREEACSGFDEVIRAI